VEETACLIIHKAVSKKRFDTIDRQANYRGSKLFLVACAIRPYFAFLSFSGFLWWFRNKKYLFIRIFGGNST
jgi:hypothetical protein